MTNAQMLRDRIDHAVKTWDLTEPLNRRGVRRMRRKLAWESWGRLTVMLIVTQGVALVGGYLIGQAVFL